MGNTLRLTAIAAAALTPLLAQAGWSQINQPTPATGTTLSNSGSNARTGVLVAPSNNNVAPSPQTPGSNTVPVLVNPATPAAGTTLTAPGTNVQSTVQTIRGNTTPFTNTPSGDNSSPSTANPNAIGVPGTSGTATQNSGGTTAPVNQNNAPNGRVDFGPTTNQPANNPIQTQIVPIFPTGNPNAGNQSGNPGTAPANNQVRPANQQSFQTGGQAQGGGQGGVVGAAPGTLDGPLLQATCSQNWGQAARIVDRAIAAAPAGQSAYRAQLQNYRSRLQSLQSARTFVPGWSQQCTGS